MSSLFFSLDFDFVSVFMVDIERAQFVLQYVSNNMQLHKPKTSKAEAFLLERRSVRILSYSGAFKDK